MKFARVDNFSIFFIVFVILITHFDKVAANADISFHGTLLKTPACRINNDDAIYVNFGDALSINKVQSGIYRAAIPIEIECDGSSASWGLRLSVSGILAEFDSENATLVSDQQNALGVKIYHNGSPVVIDEKITLNHSGANELEAVLVQKDGVKLADGIFSATASLRAEYF
ncbi:fimbrial protein [Enterobacter cloacae]|uniref:fimbrial protein n=1 Tax=Enterobacter cloacae TaxID=550 RepID=UPI002003B2BA|nr:fimbrial protein [Enterobacter cloacae]MCK7268878.1 fimbrial protein [Enterobacter cloacae]